MLNFWNNLIEDLRTQNFCDKTVMERIDPYFNYQLFKRRDECNHSLLGYSVIYNQINLIDYFLAKIKFYDLEDEYQDWFSQEILHLFFNLLRKIDESYSFIQKFLNTIFNGSFIQMIDIFIKQRGIDYFEECTFFNQISISTMSESTKS